jgi:hypothetical protein
VSATEPPTASQLDFFETRIRPVLSKHCFSCHSAQAKSLKAGLLLDSREGIRRGGDTGTVVVPKDANQSLLLDALRYESFEMPPKGKLADHVIADFEQWIREGAADPRDGKAATKQTIIDIEEGRSFWSFQPIRKPPPPRTDNTNWPRSDIDRFVLAKLESAGIPPNRDAESRTLVRRIYFDLHGLPPTAAQIREFLADNSATRLEDLVDRLLDSPRYGERWGRHWLDVVRFAESTGGGRTKILRDAWRYRDYVVEAFNRDRPYDQFVAEQIAGDLLPFESPEQRARQLTATSFLGLGPINYELQDKTLLTMEIVDEQLDTIGRAMLGMTIGCARCHDHKFDPIPTRDYYAMAGFFRSTKTVEHANVSNLILRALPVDAEWQKRLDQYAIARKTLESTLSKARKERDAAAKMLGVQGVSLTTLPGTVVDDLQAKSVGSWTPSTSIPGYLGSRYLFTEGSPSGDRQLVFAAEDLAAGEYEIRVSYTASSNRASNTLIEVTHSKGKAKRRIDQKKKPPIDGTFISLGRFQSTTATPISVTISNKDADGVVIADTVQFLPVDVPEAPAADSALTSSVDSVVLAARETARRELQQMEAAVTTVEAELKKLTKQAPKSAPKVISVKDQENVEDCRLHIRGSVKNLGEVIPRGFLQVATYGAMPTIAKDQSGRVDLASWITSPANPLTARVISNRVWLHLFGQGIVRTPDNFGTVGQPPSHPELLDHLAHHLIADQWSIKRLIRRIVLSRVYQLDSEYQTAAAAVDPENRLLWRANRRRLEAEAIRDSILAVAGQLDLKVGGSLIKPSVSSEFGYRFTSHRRSVYVPVFRNALHELFEVFDFANPNLVSGQRDTSTLPTQALYLMNSPFVMDQATAAAKLLLAHPGDLDSRIHLAYERSLGRPPSAVEFELAQAYLNLPMDVAMEVKTEQWARFQQTLFSCLDFRYVK